MSDTENDSPAQKDYDPGENIPDRVQVPDKTVYVLTEFPNANPLPAQLIESLAGQRKRSWFNERFYFCLPLTFGNQHGFIVKLLYDVVVRWDGGDDLASLYVHRLGREHDHTNQIVSSHFGKGILTIQNRWHYRTPRGTNLLVMPPPNFYVPGITHLTAVVQSDQLRRDFTFNLKVTEKDRDILLPAGEPIGCILPFPRGFADAYNIALHPEGEVLENERKTIHHFSNARREYDLGGPGRIYMRGEDVYGNKFPEHQKVVPPGMFFDTKGGTKPTEEGRGVRASLSAKAKEDRTPTMPRRKPKMSKLADTPDESPSDEGLEKVRAKHYSYLPQKEFAALLDYVGQRLGEGRTFEEVQAILVNGGWRAAFAADLIGEIREKNR